MDKLKPFLYGLAVGILLLMAWLFGSRNAARKALERRKAQVSKEIQELEHKILVTENSRKISPEEAQRLLKEYDERLEDKKESLENLLVIETDENEDEDILSNLALIFDSK